MDNNAAVPKGDYITLLTDANVIVLGGTKTQAVEARLRIDSGTCAGEQLRLLVDASDETSCHRSFYRLGGVLHALTTVDIDCKGLIGNLLMVSVDYDDQQRQSVIIKSFLGRESRTR